MYRMSTTDKREKTGAGRGVGGWGVGGGGGEWVGGNGAEE